MWNISFLVNEPSFSREYVNRICQLVCVCLRAGCFIRFYTVSKSWISIQPNWFMFVMTAVTIRWKLIWWPISVAICLMWNYMCTLTNRSNTNDCIINRAPFVAMSSGVWNENCIVEGKSQAWIMHNSGNILW